MRTKGAEYPSAQMPNATVRNQLERNVDHPFDIQLQKCAHGKPVLFDPQHQIQSPTVVKLPVAPHQNHRFTQ